MIHTYRYGSEREEGEGLRIGVARQVPRGVKKEDWQRRGYFDIRAPALAPSMELVGDYRHDRIGFKEFARRYRAEMKSEASRELIDFLAAMVLYQPVSLGCFCENESRCHRSLLREIVTKEAEEKAAFFHSLKKEKGDADSRRFASPVCLADFSKD